MQVGGHLGQHVGQHFGSVGVLLPIVDPLPKRLRITHNAIACRAEHAATVLCDSLPIAVTIVEVDHG